MSKINFDIVIRLSMNTFVVIKAIFFAIFFHKIYDICIPSMIRDSLILSSESLRFFESFFSE